MKLKDYKDCLYYDKDSYQTVTSLNSKKHEMIITKQNKLATNNFDLKRMNCDGRLNSEPYTDL